MSEHAGASVTFCFPFLETLPPSFHLNAFNGDKIKQVPLLPGDGMNFPRHSRSHRDLDKRLHSIQQCGLPFLSCDSSTAQAAIPRHTVQSLHAVHSPASGVRPTFCSGTVQCHLSFNISHPANSSSLVALRFVRGSLEQVT